MDNQITQFWALFFWAKNGCVTLASRCTVDIKANRQISRDYVRNSMGVVTALVPVTSYEQSAAIAKEALQTGSSVFSLVLEKILISKKELDNILKPENITAPQEILRK